MKKYKILELDNFVPIDKRYVASQRAEIVNVPNSDWDEISRDIDLINNEMMPTTLRVYKLNSLPFHVIQILNPHLTQ